MMLGSSGNVRSTPAGHDLGCEGRVSREATSTPGTIGAVRERG
jgi:hypothetical protein